MRGRLPRAREKGGAATGPSPVDRRKTGSTKVGGWPPWGSTDPYPRYCAVCEARTVPLLTIASFEWYGGEGRSWAPQEDQAAAADSHYAGLDPSQPTGVEVGSTDNMQIYICPDSPEQSHTDLIQ